MQAFRCIRLFCVLANVLVDSAIVMHLRLQRPLRLSFPHSSNVPARIRKARRNTIALITSSSVPGVALAVNHS